MRKIFSYLPLFFAASVLFFTACEETDRAFPEAGTVETGAIARLVDGINGNFDYENIDGSQIDFTVEFFDANNGQDVAMYSWAVIYNGVGPTAIKSVDSGSFSINGDGLPQVSMAITFKEVLDALGLDQSGIVLGQAFDLQATITMKDGRTFTSANTSSNLQSQPVFLSLMAIRQGVINLPCISVLAGTYDAKATATNQMAGIGWDGCEGASWNGQVRFIAQHDDTSFGTGVYIMQSFNDNMEWVDDASMGGFYTCYTGSLTNPGALPTGTDDNGMLRLNEDCGSLFWTGASQWGETYTIEAVTVSGPELTIAWANDYGEGASVTLTRTDGTDWPSDLVDGDG
jgi:hypothetical protein